MGTFEAAGPVKTNRERGRSVCKSYEQSDLGHTLRAERGAEWLAILQSGGCQEGQFCSPGDVRQPWETFSTAGSPEGCALWTPSCRGRAGIVPPTHEADAVEVEKSPTGLDQIPPCLDPLGLVLGLERKGTYFERFQSAGGARNYLDILGG